MSQSGLEGNGQTDGEPNGQQDNGTGTDSGQGTGNGGGSSADSAQQNGGNDTGQDTVSRADFERLTRQLSEADRKRSQAETELQKIKDADLSELDKSKKDLQTVTGERDALQVEVDKLRLSNAFLSANDISWQDSEVALDIAQAKGYLADAVKEDGTVDAKELKKALKKLSEDHKYLVKSKSNSDEEDEDEEQPPSGRPAPRGRGNANDDKARMERLKQDLPALGRR